MDREDIQRIFEAGLDEADAADVAALLADENLTHLSLSELAELEAYFADRTREVMAADTGLSAVERTAALTEIKLAVDAIREEMTEQGEAQAEAEAAAAELAEAILGDEDPDAEVSDEEGAEATAEVEVEAEATEVAEVEAEAVETEEVAEVTEVAAEVEEVVEAAPVPVAAAAAPARRPINMEIVRNARPAQFAPQAPEGAEHTPGWTLDNGRPADRMAIAERMLEVVRQLPAGRSSAPAQQVAVASFGVEYSEARTLDDNPFKNQQKLDDLFAPEALVATGGFCAPFETDYDVDILAEDLRPVRNAFPNMRVTRGGIEFFPWMGSVRPGAVAAEIANTFDATVANLTSPSTGYPGENIDEDGTGYPKNFGVVDCPTPAQCEVYALSQILQFGNFHSRTFPENVAAWTDQANAYFAQQSETILLDTLTTTSVAVTAGVPTLGSFSEIVGHLSSLVAGMRNRERNYSRGLRYLAPIWMRDAMKADIARAFTGSDGPVLVSDADVDNLIRACGLNPSWYVDSDFSADQYFGAQGAGALLTFPTTARQYVWWEGSYVLLDGGDLNLGVVRDSVLNGTNDFQIFSETFEALCNVGRPAIALESEICISGLTAGNVGYDPALGPFVACPTV